MSKGSVFERKVCKIISLWWTKGKSDGIFWRTAMSGGRATVRGRKGQKTNNQCGDVCATDPIGQPFIDVFSLELKRGYSKFTPFDAIDKLKGYSTFEQWIVQAEESERQSGSFTHMLIFQRTRREIIVAFPSAVEIQIGLFQNRYFPMMRMNLTHDWRYTFLTLEGFLDRVDPNLIRQLSEN